MARSHARRSLTRRTLVGAAGVLAALAACSSTAKPPPLPSCTDCDASAGGIVPVCGSCTQTSDCAASLLCSADGYCALQCSTSTPCPLGLPCKEGLCVCTRASGDAGEAGADAMPDAADSATDSGSDQEAGGVRPAAGLVQVTTATYGSSSSTVAGAQFTAAGGPCLPSVVAGCLVTTCFGELPPGPTAGALTLTGGGAPDGGIVLDLDPDAGGYGVFRDLGANDFPSGSTILVSAAGGAVPAFTTSVVAATDVYLASLPASLDRQHDATITWNQGSSQGGSIGTVIVSIAAQSPDVTVVCSSPVSSGSLTLPAAALQQLPTGHLSAVSLGVQNDTLSVAGTTAITARHATIVHTPSGDEQLPVAVPIVN